MHLFHARRARGRLSVRTLVLSVSSLFGLILPSLWAAAALWFDGGPGWRGILLSGVFVALVIGVWCFMRSRRAAVLATVALFSAVLVWWLALEPRNDRDWLEDVMRPPRAQLQGNILTIENVRNFRYRGTGDQDYEVRWETRRYDLDKIVGLDIFLSDWGAPIVHTIMSWRFADGPPLAISIETRKEKGETYSAVAGFFRQYELYYVVADERDVIGVRAAHRGERVQLYELAGQPGGARRLLDGYVKAMNSLVERPRWYNALTTNCTTVIFDNVRHVFGRSNIWDWRIYANKNLPAMLHERGVINDSMPLTELARASDVTERAIAADGQADFSQQIRVGLPSPPGR